MSTEEKENKLENVAKPQFKVSSNKGFSETFPTQEKAYSAYEREKAKYLKKQIPFRLSLKTRESSQEDWQELEQTVRTNKHYEED